MRNDSTTSPEVESFVWCDMPERDRIVAEIKSLGEKLGRAPSQRELRTRCRISWHQVRKHFGGMSAAIRAAGLEPGAKGRPADERALVLDWARVVRELGRLPTQAKYDERGKHTAGTLHARIGWREMGHRFVLLVREFRLGSEWEDVLQVVWRKYPWLKHLAGSNWENRFIGTSGQLATGKAENLGGGWPVIGAQAGVPPPQQMQRAHFLGTPMPVPQNHDGMRLGRVVAAALAIEILFTAERQLKSHSTQSRPEIETHREKFEAETRVPQRACGGAVYGEPLGLAAMAHAPTNEDGVLFLFGVVAADLGFRIERVQQGFPDIAAKREVAPGLWELQLWELEWCSRNFKDHGHDPKGCHGIICWKHNWPDVPKGLEVIELSKVVKEK